MLTEQSKAKRRVIMKRKLRKLGFPVLPDTAEELIESIYVFYTKHKGGRL